MFHFPLKSLRMLLSATTESFVQQTRNTYILKRKWPPGLHKKDKIPERLRARHFVYELIENTDLRKSKPIDIILKQYVKGVGQKGELITMKPNIAYNELLLPGLAVYATPENLEKYKQDTIIEKPKFSSPYVEHSLNILSKLCLRVHMSLDNPWTLEKWHVKSAFRKTSFVVPEDAITLPEKQISGPDLSIDDKEFVVTVTINNTEQAKVRCKIHHWTANPDTVWPNRLDPFKFVNEPIFPEDKPILDSLTTCLKTSEEAGT
ncbi:39S ribosomal protein L9, mitochondrial [Orussus abietinus]|uniref:39S ribosomal protein L9, mitochondrial n=1 Tax=Orussus abietinus TaxID=222816 RepID=UPI000625B1C1|nr:39S ribosomal protein L9, mitochondrial [Orussus abietinus]